MSLRWVSALCLLAVLRAHAGAQLLQPKTPAGSSRVVVLWPGGAPGALGSRDEDVPKLFCYPAPEQRDPDPRGARPLPRRLRSAVIVMPGGGYRSLEVEKEGGAAARWLNAHGITAFVLQYRLGPRYHFPAPMQDGARALRYVRSHAGELGVAPNRIGVWGFSAGGHLGAFLATTNSPGDPRSPDPTERVSDRPDFAILSYARLSMDPAIPRPTNLEALIGEHPTPEMLNTVWIEKHVSHTTPPCFLFSTTGDQTVNSLNATAFYDALKRAEVPAELHIFERGPHGVGMGQGLRTLPELAAFATLLENWLLVHDLIEEGR